MRSILEKLSFGELELSILAIVRKLKLATVRDVCNNLKRDSCYTTIMTVMSRMANKGDLIREKQGNQYVYWISAKNKSFSLNILNRIKNKVFGGKSFEMVNFLLEDQTLSEKDFEELEKLIKLRKLERKNNG